jgi:hypothetical protein
MRLPGVVVHLGVMAATPTLAVDVVAPWQLWPGPSRGGQKSANYRRTLEASSGQSKPRYQVCWKVGHTAGVYWYRFDEEFILDQHMDAMASSSNNTDPNWYLDSVATDHITGELEKHKMHERYGDNEQIKAANGTGMGVTPRVMVLLIFLESPSLVV